NQRHGHRRERVHDRAHRHAARVQPDVIDAVDATLEVEHPPVRANLHYEPNSDETVSLRRLIPAGVASRTATIPTANTPAASLKSRRNASTVAAIANARPIKLIATVRPGAPALLAAVSSELPVLSPPDARSAAAGAGTDTDASPVAAKAPATASVSTTTAASTSARVRITRPGPSERPKPPSDPAPGSRRVRNRACIERRGVRPRAPRRAPTVHQATSSRVRRTRAPAAAPGARRGPTP